jgi:hypothetical protein
MVHILETHFMETPRFLLAGLAVVALTACEGGGVDLKVQTVDNSVDNSQTTTGEGSNNPCASYTVPNSNEVRRGSFDGRNCVYGSDFVGTTNPLRVNLTIPFISGVHIFQDSLFVGQNVSSGAAPAAGSGPKLTIAAGNTLAFADSADYVLINRGSQIAAEGSPSAPITFTAFADAVSNTAGANDVSLWGGIVINGNGITNNCTDAQRQSNQCHVTAEGQPSNYGGNNNTESSGALRYVIVKHTGFEVAPGDELNGITFNAVGSGTVVENVQAYSTYDDGFEFFGGAVNVKNAIVLFARDDSLDYSDGYVGTIDRALVIHYKTDGNRCIEGDNIGEGRSNAGAPLDTAPLTQPTFKNLTCITSNVDAATHGDSEGPLARQGAKIRLQDTIVYAGYGVTANGKTSNECIEVESGVSLGFAASGESRMVDTIVACEEPAKGTLANGDPLLDWANGRNPSTNGANYSFNEGNKVITDSANANVAVLEAKTYFTATAFKDATGAAFTMSPASGQMGAVRRSDDWTSPWAFGLRTANADEPLWITQ